MRRVRILGVDAEVADTAFRRLLGLIGRGTLEPGRGLLIPKCNCIHTCFMRFPIDAAFLDARGRVAKVVRGIRPWRLWVWGGLRSRSVLEVRSGATDFDIIRA